MRICGVELKGSDAIVFVIEANGDKITPHASLSSKISFGESSEPTSARFFYEAICSFIRDCGITHIAIKQRATRGQFAGGAVTFKMEALFQLNSDTVTHLLSASAIAAIKRRNTFELPADLKRYQEEAFLTGCCAAVRLRK